jgi:hypothetical protein
MAYLVVLVVDQPDHCPAVLDRWEEAGAAGVTILESTGIGRLRQHGARDDFSLMPSLMELLRAKEIRHRTLFSVVENKQRAQRLIDAAEEVLGDLDQPNTGFLFLVAVEHVLGLKGSWRDSAGEEG